MYYIGILSKKYGDGTQNFHDEVVTGHKKKHISLHKSILVATSLDPRMKMFSPFINDDDREATFEYLLTLMGDDFDNFLILTLLRNQRLMWSQIMKVMVKISQVNMKVSPNYLGITITRVYFLMTKTRYVMPN